MQEEGLSDHIAEVNRHMGVLHAEFMRCRQLAMNPETEGPDQFAANWVMREIRMGLEQATLMLDEINAE